MMKKKRKTKNSGVCNFYLQSNAKNSYSAKKNVTSLADLQFVKSKFFSIESIRQEDVAFAETLSMTLSQKIKVQYDCDITTKNKAVIKGVLFDIIKIDHAPEYRETYIYLSEVRRLEG